MKAATSGMPGVISAYAVSHWILRVNFAALVIPAYKA